MKLSNLGNELSKVAQQLDMYAKEAYFYGSLRSLLHTFINVPEYFGQVQHGPALVIMMDLITL